MEYTKKDFTPDQIWRYTGRDDDDNGALYEATYVNEQFVVLKQVGSTSEKGFEYGMRTFNKEFRKHKTPEEKEKLFMKNKFLKLVFFGCKNEIYELLVELEI